MVLRQYSIDTFTDSTGKAPGVFSRSRWKRNGWLQKDPERPELYFQVASGPGERMFLAGDSVGAGVPGGDVGRKMLSTIERVHPHPQTPEENDL